METVNIKILDKEMVMGMLGAMWTNMRRLLIIILIMLNISTLAISAVHDFLYKGLSSLPVADLLQNSSTEKKKKLVKQNEALKTKLTTQKITTKKIAKRIAIRTARITAINVSSTIAEAAPYVGIGVILAVTALEIKASCENLQDINELVQSLEIEPNQNETSKVCGQELPSITW